MINLYPELEQVFYVSAGNTRICYGETEYESMEGWNMKVWKLVSGILCIVLFAFVSFQSCAVGVANSLGNSTEASGSAGIILAVLMLSGGIVSISTRNSASKGSDIALIVLFSIAALFGFILAGSFSDLKIWAGWCLINAITAIVSLNNKKKAGV